MTNKLRILHVDDEPDILKVVKTILDKEGYDVVSAESGKDALKEIIKNHFSLILLDVMMPDMSGWDLFTRIADIKKGYKVIFLTVLEASTKKIKEMKKSGIKDYITKPFDRADLVARVKKAIAS